MLKISIQKCVWKPLTRHIPITHTHTHTIPSSRPNVVPPPALPARACKAPFLFPSSLCLSLLVHMFLEWRLYALFIGNVQRRLLLKYNTLLSHVRGHADAHTHTRANTLHSRTDLHDAFCARGSLWIIQECLYFKKKKLLGFESVTFQMSLSHLIPASLWGEPQHLCQ